MAARVRRAGVRLLPAVIVSLAALAAMKGAELLLGGQELSPISVATAQDAGQPGATGGDQAGGGGAPATQTQTQTPAMNAPPPGQDTATLSESERAVLENLRARREALEERERGLVVRENLLRAAELRIDNKIDELRALEETIRVALSEKEESDDEQFANLVTMYQAMKPKAAAAIFNRLNLDISVGVARRMQPEAMAEVLSRMDPAMAEQLTRAMVQVDIDEAQLVGELEAIAPR